MNRGQVAKSVRENKERHPEQYCAAPRCLWALRSGSCPKHRNERHAIQLGSVVVDNGGDELGLPEVEECQN